MARSSSFSAGARDSSSLDRTSSAARLTRWQPYWFELFDNGALLQYRSQDETGLGSARAVICVDECIETTVTAEQHTLSVSSQVESWQLATTSKEAMLQWVGALRSKFSTVTHIGLAVALAGEQGARGGLPPAHALPAAQSLTGLSMHTPRQCNKEVRGGKYAFLRLSRLSLSSLLHRQSPSRSSGSGISEPVTV